MNKKQQKDLLKEIMDADARDGLYEPTVSKMETTAVDWLFENIQDVTGFTIRRHLYDKAKAMEQDQRIKDYNAGYEDGRCNHVNDAENYAYEIEYIKSKIEELDNKIKPKQNNIASMLINGNSKEDDKEVTDYTIGPFGTPEKL